MPQATDGFFESCKTQLDEQFNNAKAYLNGVNISVYDSNASTSASPNAAGGVGSSAQANFDSLPSSAMWLLNKILNADESDDGFALSGAISTLESTFNTFVQAAGTSNLVTDFSAAMSDLVNLFLSFVSRDTMDATPIDAIMDTIKHLIDVILDLVKPLVLAFANMAAQALTFWMQFLDAPVNLPLISSVFKAVTGVDLT